MSNMQSKADENNESFYWYLKTLREQEQKQMAASQPENEQEINILRFIKLLEPTVERLMAICEKELGVSLLTVSSTLESLEKAKEIEFLQNSESPRTIRITEKGLARLENGG